MRRVLSSALAGLIAFNLFGKTKLKVLWPGAFKSENRIHVCSSDTARGMSLLPCFGSYAIQKDKAIWLSRVLKGVF